MAIVSLRLLCASATSADGYFCVKLRIAVTTADVRFSIAYIAFESVAAACTVAWCGMIRARVESPPRPPPRVPVAVLATSEMVVDLRASIRLGVVVSVGASVEGSTTPVRASKMSDTGGSGSAQGTVKSGLSQRLCVLGSS